MSDRDPNQDWEPPRLEQSRGGAPHYSGRPDLHGDVPLAASGWARNKATILGIALAVVMVLAGPIVYLLTK